MSFPLTGPIFDTSNSLPVTKGKARFEMLIRKKTGAVQVGLASVSDTEWLGDCFGDDNFAGKAWYVSSTAKVDPLEHPPADLNQTMDLD